MTQNDVTALILAGGKASRMGGIDKGLYHWQNKPLVEHVIDRVKPQTRASIISSNRNIEIYRRYTQEVVPDLDYIDAGPLSGILNAGRKVTTPYLLVVPCDTPQLPLDLVVRMFGALEKTNQSATYAHDGTQSQHLIMLMAASLLADLDRYLQSGNRKVMGFLLSINAVATDFSDVKNAFLNINELVSNP